MKNIFEELKKRGIVGQYTENISNLFDTKINVYLGTDPTADSLHVGHLAPIITLKRLQNYGCKPYLLIGGATGMIGDPSFKNTERVFLDSEIIKKNNYAEIIDNADWYSKMNVIDFLRDAGKNITVNYMSAKESVKKRIISGMSFTEFSYQILQAYDFYYLHNKYGINLQIGGDDQWGNITSGVDFIRKKISQEVHAFTIKLITKEDGTKFGKTESGTVWLDSAKTSPYEFYQFWMNRSDSEVEKYIKIFSLKNIEEIEEMIKLHNNNPENRFLQKELAKEMTIFIHGKEEYENIRNSSESIFGNCNFEDLLKIKNIESFLKNINNKIVQKEEVFLRKTYYDLLSQIAIPELFKSKSEIKRSFEEKSIYINKNKIENENLDVDKDIFKNNFIIIQKGKKKYFVVFLR